MPEMGTVRVLHKLVNWLMAMFFFAMLPSVRFTEEKVLFFFILREKC